MGELGAWLKETREAKGLSTEEVEATTRIRRAFLQALEEGEYELLPGEVYVRGFLRNYALYLGLDPAEVHRRYDEEMASQGLWQRTQDWSTFRPIDVALEFPRQPISVWIQRILLILLLLAGAAGAAAWYWYGLPLPQPPGWWPFQADRINVWAPTTAPTEHASGPSPLGIPSLPPATATSIPPPSATVPRLGISAAATPAPPSPALPPTRVVATSAVLPLPTPAPFPTATASPTPTPVPTTPEPQGLHLTAHIEERAWLQVTTDGEMDFQGILEAGEERTWQAEHSIALRCGNAGGVLITVNGEDLGLLGERGQVVDQTWVIQEEEAIIATAAPSSS